MRLSIRARIIMGFLMIYVITIAIGAYSMYSIDKISKMSEERTLLQVASTDISDVLAAHYGWRQNLTVAVLTGTEFTGSYDPENCTLGMWIKSSGTKQTANSKILSLIDEIDAPHRYIHSEAENIVQMIREGHNEQAQKEFLEKVLPNADKAISLLTEMTVEYENMMIDESDKIHDVESRSFTLILVLVISCVLIGATFTIFVVKIILNPLRRLATSARLAAEGNFNLNFSYPINDEVGILTRNLGILVETLRRLMSDMNTMAANHSDGEIEFFMSSDSYSGDFKEVVSGINHMISEYVDSTLLVLNTFKKYAEGDFTAKLPLFPGKKVIANKILDSVALNLQSVEDSVMTLVTATLNGELDKRIDVSNFKGDWKIIITSMNNLLEAVDAPLVEAQKALLLVSNGKLDVKITGNYKGQFEKMSDSINRTVEVLSTYIMEISSTLNMLASDNFNVQINREYVGSFSDIKISLNAIIDRLNNIINEIGSAAVQVAAGAKQISETSISLSQGSTEQASSVEQLNSTIEDILSNTLKNAENSTVANNLVDEVKEDARQGTDEMKYMLNSMTDIKDSSNDISKIIKVIEDISFQTNLLALNAAVEAARAGTHGKGFAVVAEEVRSLAGRSQNAVKETSDLIERSITTVNEGTRIANETALALTKIVKGVDDISDIILKIEASSSQQAEAISHINQEIGHISEVTLSTSSTSEESAAASEELLSQSEMLKSMINRFELRK